MTDQEFFDRYAFLGLTRSPMCVLMQLMRRQYVANENIGSGKVLQVHVCRLRKTLKPWNVEIQTIVGVGYKMPGPDKLRLEAAAVAAAAEGG